MKSAGRFTGASAEEAATRIHVRLRGHRVGQVIVLEPVCLPADLRVGDALAVLCRTSQDEFPVVLPAGAYFGLTTASALRSGFPASPCVLAH